MVQTIRQPAIANAKTKKRQIAPGEIFKHAIQFPASAENADGLALFLAKRCRAAIFDGRALVENPQNLVGSGEITLGGIIRPLASAPRSCMKNSRP